MIDKIHLWYSLLSLGFIQWGIMGNKYRSLYLSLCLHFVAAAVVFFALPTVLKSPQAPLSSPAISIEIVALEAEVVMPTRAEPVPELESELVSEPEVVDEMPVQLTENQPDEPVVEEKINEVTKEDSDQDETEVPTSNWTLGGFNKAQYPDGLLIFQERELIPNLFEDGEFLMKNPLMGNGALPNIMPSVKRLEVKGSKSVWRSHTARRSAKRRGGGSAVGPYGSKAYDDPLAVGVGVISYAANTSNCAHEQARTGVNRCNQYERWISQRVHDFMVEVERQGKN